MSSIESSPLSREQRLAWLLRGDIREGAPLDDVEAQKRFVAWWALHGEMEFPAAAGAPRPVDLAILAEPLMAVPGEDALPITRLMDAVWKMRQDVQEKFPYQDPPARAPFMAWFYCNAVKEHGLFPWLAPDQVAALLQAQATPEGVTPPPLNLLQRELLQKRSDVREALSEDSPMGLLRLHGWYYTAGVLEAGHMPYYALVPVPWLHASHPKHKKLSWLMVLAWAFHFQLQKGPNQFKREKDVAAWFNETLAPRLPYALPDKTGRAARSNSPRYNSLWPNLVQPNLLRPKAMEKTLPFGVNVVGYAMGELGIGEDTRMAVASLEAAGVPCRVVNIPLGNGGREQDGLLAHRLGQGDAYFFNLLCMTGFDTAQTWLVRGGECFPGSYTIGYWPWELAAWPAPWREACSLVDVLWSSTRFAQQAFQGCEGVPVHWMPMGVTVDRLVRHPRHFYALPEERFLFLYVFDCNSYVRRKDPQAALAAFQQAFPGGEEEVGLVIKTMNPTADNPDWLALQQAAAADERITLLTETLDRGDVLGLFAVCDAYLSPHRGEGFGRTLAEAMLLEKPVIATDYSGSTDFLTPETGFPVAWTPVPIGPGEYPCGEGQQWAKVDVADMARQMRLVIQDPQEAARRARQGRAFIEYRHAPQAVGERYREQLHELGRRLGVSGTP